MGTIFKKILLFLVTGSLSVFIAACYGVLMPIDRYRLLFIQTHDQNSRPIKGIAANLYCQDTNSTYQIDSAYTDSNGLAKILFDEIIDPKVNARYSVRVKDIDSIANGGWFADKEEEVTAADTLKIELQLKNQ